MKKNYLTYVLLGLLGISLTFNVLMFKNVNGIKDSNEKQSKILFEISNVSMHLYNEYGGHNEFSGSNPYKLRVDFEIENISNESLNFPAECLSVFNYLDNRYDYSIDGPTRDFVENQYTPISVFVNIGPKIKKKVTVGFEVPRNELYFLGCTDNIEIKGKQTFIDEVRKFRSEYEKFETMVQLRKTIISQPSSVKTTEEVIVDLNDYLGEPNDDTDWNYTEFSDEVEKSLMKKGVYYSPKKDAWVKKVMLK